MSQQDLFDRIVASLHAGVLDDARWPAVSALIDEACRAKGNHLVFSVESKGDIDICFLRFCYRGIHRTDWEREYFRDYYPADEHLPLLRQLPDSKIVHVTELLSEEQLKTSLIYNKAMPRFHFQDGLNVRLDGPHGSRIIWGIADPSDGSGWSSDQIDMVTRLLPHIRQFVRIRHALAEARALGASIIELLDNIRIGVIQLDRRGRVTAVNDRARAMLRARDGLWDEDGRVRASLPEEDAAFQRLLARALPLYGGPGVGGSMVVRRSQTLSRLVLHVSPVHDAAGDAGQRRMGALVLAVDPADRTGLDPARVGHALGLTPAESHIAVLLAQGETIDAVAAKTGRHRTTVKWHIRHIYAKHNLSRQIELAQLVASVTDVPGVRD